MANQITYGDKTSLLQQDGVAAQNKVTAEEMNEIKARVNELVTAFNNIVSRLGITENAANWGTFAGVTVADNISELTAIISALEAAIEAVNAGNLTANSVDNTHLADMPEGTVKVRRSAGAGDPENATFAELKSDLSIIAADISDLQGAISGNTDVTSNTANKHTHSNKTELDLITDAGSGVIISAAERTNVANNTSKLAGIEVNAKDDQTGEEIRDLYESLADRNPFTDTYKGNVDTNNTKVSADGSISTHSDVDTSTLAPSVGDRLEWNGLNWVPVTPSGGSGANLTLANRDGSTLDILSDTGTDVTIPSATTSLSGLATGADKTNIDANTAARHTHSNNVVLDGITSLGSGAIIETAERNNISTNNAKVSADGSIDTHSDVDTTTTAPNTGDVLEWNGSTWVPAAPAGGGGTDDQTAAEVSVSATPTNYTAGTADVEAHLAGIDTALGSAGGSTPAWQAWTMTVQQGGAVFEFAEGRYQEVGNTVHFQGRFINDVGSTVADAGTGVYQIALPVTGRVLGGTLTNSGRGLPIIGGFAAFANGNFENATGVCIMSSDGTGLRVLCQIHNNQAQRDWRSSWTQSVADASYTFWGTYEKA